MKRLNNGYPLDCAGRALSAGAIVSHSGAMSNNNQQFVSSVAVAGSLVASVQAMALESSATARVFCLRLTNWGHPNRSDTLLNRGLRNRSKSKIQNIAEQVQEVCTQFCRMPFNRGAKIRNCSSEGCERNRPECNPKSFGQLLSFSKSRTGIATLPRPNLLLIRSKSRG